MLQYSTVEPATLAVLKKLMAMPELEHFSLVGGTALALYYGHRLSVDLDLFCTENFDTDILIPTLEKSFPAFAYDRPSNIGIFGFIGNIKVDLIRYYRHQLIGRLVIDDGIRLMSVKDIAAMKVAAILKRAVKKDFWDIAELLDHFTIEQIIDCYNEKYPNQQLLISIPHALTYFADAEESESPVSLRGQTWEKVKIKIQERVSAFMR